MLAPAGLGHMQPLRVIVAGDNGITAAVALSDLGKYVPVDIRNIDTEHAEAGDDGSADDGTGVRLYQSVYETALRNNVPGPVIAELIRVFSYDVDFQRKALPGDSFDVLYSDDESGEGRNEVRYAALTVGGDTKRYYHFQTADDGAYDYYDESGVSSKKFLVRKPVANGMVTSGFGWRTHPLLHISELHSGVDWAAPPGTPIFAAGNGEIEEIGQKGGYGKYVRMRHANGYETAYGHMTAFARGLPTTPRGSTDGQVEGPVVAEHHPRAVPHQCQAGQRGHQRSLRHSDDDQIAARPRARRRDSDDLRSRARSARRRAVARELRARGDGAVIGKHDAELFPSPLEGEGAVVPLRSTG